MGSQQPKDVCVRDMMWPQVFRVEVGDSVQHAADYMCERNVGSALVFDNDSLIGVITERDLMLALAEGANGHQAIVRDFMTEYPVTIDVEATPAEAAATLLAIGARHLPVTRGAEVVGVLSARDLLEFVAGSERSKRRRFPRRYDGPQPHLAPELVKALKAVEAEGTRAQHDRRRDSDALFGKTLSQERGDKCKVFSP